jgi:hydrogenase 3 maturation protease
LKTGILSTLIQRLQGAGKIVILGIGSELMQDDAAGVTVAKALEKKFGEGNSKFKIIAGHTTPENFTSVIKEFHPEHIIIVDAADLKQQPGTVIDLPVEVINDYTLGTHKLSLIMMIRYLKETIGCGFTVLAIQYKQVEFDGKMTKEVRTGVKKTTSQLSEIIEKYYS